jgi:hypothetical protein
MIGQRVGLEVVLASAFNQFESFFGGRLRLAQAGLPATTPYADHRTLCGRDGCRKDRVEVAALTAVDVPVVGALAAMQTKARQRARSSSRRV